MRGPKIYTMKFVALLSGGKDSCYNVMVGQRHGHDLVCLANLVPPASAGEEMNSFMYQTAAHNAIPHLAVCFGVPLLRREISGDACCQALDYSPTTGDEVEDLYMLLAEVKAQYPEVQGVSCGAILSTYQRLRVEHVCQRLGLTVLSYLWQRNQAQLLDEMLASGVDAVLVKVAGAGLEPHKHLGKSLRAMRGTLEALHAKFGLDLCGEGGEYETLVLDCPAFQRRLVLDETDVLLDDEDCSVGNLRISACHTETKHSPPLPSPSPSPSSNASAAIARAIAVASALGPAPAPAPAPAASSDPAPGSQPRPVDSGLLQTPPSLAPLVACRANRDGLAQTATAFPFSISQVAGSTAADADADTDSATTTAAVQRQTRQVLERLALSVTRQLGARSLADTVFVHLYLADMALFVAVNEVYCQYFGTDPPSRSCVQMPLPPGVLVCADCLLLLDSHVGFNLPPPPPEEEEEAGTQLQDGRICVTQGRRSTLHVRSISEWAPTCIGPYAQANTLCEHLVLVAGQIALLPETMAVWSSPGGRSLRGATEQLSLCLKHADNVLGVSNSSIRKVFVCTVYVNAGPGAGVLDLDLDLDLDLRDARGQAQLQRVGRECALLLGALSRESNSKTGGKLQRHSRARSSSDSSSDCRSGRDSDSDSESEGEHEGCLEPLSSDFPVIVVAVSGVPRDCLVEAELAAVTHKVSTASMQRAHLRGRERLGGKDMRMVFGSGSGSGYRDDVANWPLWSGRGLLAPSTAARGGRGGVGGGGPGFELGHEAISVFASRSFCSAVVNVWIRRTIGNSSPANAEPGAATGGASTADSKPSHRMSAATATVTAGHLAGIADRLVKSALDLFQKAETDASSLVSVRVYYPVARWEREAVVAAVSVSMAALQPHFPVIYLPVLACSVSKGGALPQGEIETEDEDRDEDGDGDGGEGDNLAAHFLCADLLQMRSESWILGRS